MIPIVSTEHPYRAEAPASVPVREPTRTAGGFRRAVGRWSRALLLPIAYLLAAGVVTAVQTWVLGPGSRAALVDWASTDLTNLRGRPIESLAASAFVLEPERWSRLAVTALALTALTDRFGNRRAALIAATGHVVGTAIGQGLLATRIALHRAPTDLRHMPDVGPSYLVMAALAAVALTGRRWPTRAPAITLLAWNALSWPEGITHASVTEIGHVTACLTGALLGGALALRSRAATRSWRSPVGATPAPAAPAPVSAYAVNPETRGFDTVPHSPEEQIIRVAATAGEPFGVALGGSRGLARHGLVERDGDTVDLALAARDGKRLGATRAAIVAAWTEAGFGVGIDGKAAGKTRVRLNVRAPGAKRAIPVSLYVGPRRHGPVVVGDVPVLHPDDLAAAKVVTLGSRAELRDAFDVLALSAAYDTGRLLELALAYDPELRAEDFLTGFKHVTEREDADFRRLGYTAAQADAVRAYFQRWFAELSARGSRPIAAALDPEVLAKLARLAEPAATTERDEDA
ncbi:rhomboid-like protein [Embleya sp. NPDC020630]|uniref:rhomboid-like protein n=1 Tax=Embleya sp. NPDC020630 TaxID=3363979 RepID=UPI00379DD27E